jgi:hypothetical protein
MCFKEEEGPHVFLFQDRPGTVERVVYYDGFMTVEEISPNGKEAHVLMLVQGYKSNLRPAPLRCPLHKDPILCKFSKGQPLLGIEIQVLKDGLFGAWIVQGPPREPPERLPIDVSSYTKGDGFQSDCKTEGPYSRIDQVQFLTEDKLDKFSQKAKKTIMREETI